MLDFDEKVYALTCPSGRITSSAHRGDVVNYPENSLEAILSAIMLGADAVEIDIRLTKDNVMVLMHDDTLLRTTDWQKKKGKNGLPKSPRIEDWTYEQLRELRLLYDGKPTESLIPTLYEAAILFAGRAQIHFDCKVSDKIDRDTDIYPLAEETGSRSSFFYTFGYNMMRKWQRYDSEDVEFRNFIKKITVYLAQSGHSLRKSNFDLLSKYGDDPNGWTATYKDGYKTVFTDNIILFCRYSATKQEPLKPIKLK
jgi:glycerophosphoryl diester phosphodiesterase